MQGLTFNPTYLTSPHQGKDSCTEILTRASDPQKLLQSFSWMSWPLRNTHQGHSEAALAPHGTPRRDTGVLLPAVLAPGLLGVGAAVAVPRSTPTVA